MNLAAEVRAACAAARSMRPAPAALVVTVPIECDAPATAVPTALWDADVDAARIAWDSGALDPEDSWRWAAVGVCLRADAEGERRFAGVRDQASRFSGRVLEWTANATAQVPRARWFGGGSFRAGDCEILPWSGFGDGAFVLPRWCIGLDGAQAILRYAVDDGSWMRPDLIANRIEWVAAKVRSAWRADHPREHGATFELRDLPNGEWNALVTSALDRIRSTEASKIVAARSTHVGSNLPFDPATVFESLRHANPDCASFALEHGAGVFLGASPERLAVVRDRVCTSDALAGSEPARGAPIDERRRLIERDKDRREHAIVVEGLAAALRSVSTVVEVPTEPEVRSLPTVHHLATRLRATLREGVHVLDVVALLHPSAAVCGHPSAAAAAWIRECEPAARGWYAGPVGWFDDSGDGCFVVAIRSGVLRGREAWVYAGAGIVDGSDPASEYLETRAKQATMLRALGMAA